jgi:hypothetical protein
MVFIGPVSASTWGTQPSRFRARIMSGRRTFGSSTGSGRCSTALGLPAKRITSRATSTIFISVGFAKLLGPGIPSNFVVPSERLVPWTSEQPVMTGLVSPPPASSSGDLPPRHSREARPPRRREIGNPVSSRCVWTPLEH